MKNKNSSANRKAFPKFILLVLVFALIGFLIGMLTGSAGATDTPSSIARTLSEGIVNIAPYSIWIVTAVLGLMELRYYNQAKSLIRSWDGEQEEPVNEAEHRLSCVLFLANLNMVINFFFFGTIHILIQEHSPREFFLTLIGFIVSLVLIMLAQQKTVDLTKKINPEKQGSVYDMKFRKKWMDSCDENEKARIGQASYKAYVVTTNVCIALWVILLIISSIYPIGILPIFVVTLIWGVLSGSYCLESMKSDHPNA